MHGHLRRIGTDRGRKHNLRVPGGIHVRCRLAVGLYFLSGAGTCPVDLTRSGRKVRDAKSVLGILSLDLKKPLSLEIYQDNCDELLEELRPFIAMA